MKLTFFKFNFTPVVFLIFAFIGITATHSANAQENIRDKFLVDKIYREELSDYYLTEYFYDVDNNLIRKITTGESTEQGQLRPLKYVEVFEYENGRVSKMTHYDSTHFMFNYDTYFFYNTEGKLIRSEGRDVDGSMYKHRNYHYENGRVASIYLDGVMPFQYDSIFYDNAENITRRSYYSWGIDGLTWYTKYFEYDNHPRPNFGIDYLFAYQPLPGQGDIANDEMGLSQNNMTKMLTLRESRIYSYNEFGLPETYEIIWEGTPTLYPIIFYITYKQIGVGIIEPVQPKFVVYPNPTSGKLKIKNYELRDNSTIEIYDIFGRKQYFGYAQKSSHVSRVTRNEIDISHLPAGIYFLRVGEETVKVIKN